MASVITRWRPIAELDELRRRMDHMLDDLAGGQAREWNLAMDVLEQDGRYVLRADVPGMKPDEIQIEVQDDVLRVSAEHEETKEEASDGYVRRERHHGGFSRTMHLPKGVDAAKMEAVCHDGVLEITFPKPSDEQREVVTITPKSSA